MPPNLQRPGRVNILIYLKQEHVKGSHRGKHHRCPSKRRLGKRILSARTRAAWPARQAWIYQARLHSCLVLVLHSPSTSDHLASAITCFQEENVLLKRVPVSAHSTMFLIVNKLVLCLLCWSLRRFVKTCQRLRVLSILKRYWDHSSKLARLRARLHSEFTKIDAT